MARIRSVHPSLYTDEEFMSLSLVARVTLPGLWTECDDHGVFAWKPLTLKARILPADNVDMGAVLDELSTSQFVKRFTVDGKEFGVVRNFRKYQRPKKPSYVHPFPHELHTYIALKPDSTEPVPPHGGTEGEKPEQFVGCRMEDEGKKETLSAVADRVKVVDTDFEAFWKHYRGPKNSRKPDAVKAWAQMSGCRPPLTTLLRAVDGYHAWLVDEGRKQRREYPKQLHSTWLRGEMWNNFLSQEPTSDPIELAARMDRRDQMLNQGKYAPNYKIGEAA